MAISNSKNKPAGRAAKSVLFTIDQAGLGNWEHFETHCKKMKINKSRLIRHLIGNYLKDLSETKREEPIVLMAGTFFI